CRELRQRGDDGGQRLGGEGGVVEVPRVNVDGADAQALRADRADVLGAAPVEGHGHVIGDGGDGAEVDLGGTRAGDEPQRLGQGAVAEGDRREADARAGAGHEMYAPPLMAWVVPVM